MISSNFSSMNNSPLRTIQGKVELNKGSTSLTFSHDDKLQEITIARTGEKGKFFGFGVCQQATVKIVDNAGDLTFSKGESLQTSFRADTSAEYERVCPTFFIKEATRDEKTNVITVTAYDALDTAVGHLISEVALEPPYTLERVIELISGFLGLSGVSCPSGFDILYEQGANLGGEETIRAVLNAVAEVTQTIYYVDHNDSLVFKRLDKDGEPDLTIDKSAYFELNTALPVTITKLMHVTELGDNLDTGDDTGVVQYIRDNPFWNLRTDLATLIPVAEGRVHGLTIVPYSLKWRGNFLTEIGDKIKVETKETGKYVDTYILDDSISYKGGMSQTSSWEYSPESERTTASNPITVGEKINQTFAKVDKANREIQLVASESTANKESISNIQVNINNISSTVRQVETYVDDTIENMSARLEDLSTKIDQSYENVKIEITREITEDGITNVKTSTGYTFDDEGLRVDRTDSDLSTLISDNGMTVSYKDTEMLTANSDGVKAVNLHANTYLIIGQYSRLEDYNKSGEPRTGCFWIG